MLPTLWPGQRVRVRCGGASQLRCGDLVVFFGETGWVVHRFLARREAGGREQICQKGDARLGYSWVDAGQVLGRVVAVRGRRGTRRPGRGLGRVRARLAGHGWRIYVALRERRWLLSARP